MHLIKYLMKYIWIAYDTKCVLDCIDHLLLFMHQQMNAYYMQDFTHLAPFQNICCLVFRNIYASHGTI